MADVTNIIKGEERDGVTARDVIARYGEAKSLRSMHDNDLRMAAAYCLPSEYPLWLSEGAGVMSNRSAARRVQYDTTGTRSLPKYVSIVERIATPQGSMWHKLKASDEKLNGQRAVKLYFDGLNDLLFKQRYTPAAGFRTASNEVYQSMGVYGNGPMFIGQRRLNAANKIRGLRYIACSFRDIFFLVDDEGVVYCVFRRMWLNVRQFQMKFPGVEMPSRMKAEASKPNPSEHTVFEFVHYVCLRNASYKEDALDHRRHPYTASYIAVEGQEYVGPESGFTSMPYKIPRPATVAGDAYGYSPAVQALAALGTASQMKKTYLKQGNRAVDPVLLAHDDGILNGQIDLRPGAVNYGGVDSQGRKLIAALETGSFQVAVELIQEERKDIEDSFFVTLFQILQENPEMTATEVIERSAEKAALLSPTMGRLQSEFLGPTVEREIELLAEMGMLPEMPPELVEASGDYTVQYTSPMAKSIYAEETSGFTRAVQLGMEAAQATGDPGPLDHFDFDVAIPEIADNLGTPARWMSDPKAVQAKRDARQQQAEQAQLVQNAAGLASAANVAGQMQQGGVGGKNA